MVLHSLILAAVFHLAPATPPDRAEELYDAVSAATEDPDEALALVTTAWREGHFDRRVQDCTITGDHGRALGLFQLHGHFRGGFSRQDYCSTLSLQAQLALRALRICRGDGTVRHAFARFLGRSERDAEVNRRVTAYEKLRALSAQEVVANGW